MKGREATIAIFVGVLGVLALLYFLFFPAMNRGHNWYLMFVKDYKDPYCLYVLPEILPGYFPAGKFKTIDENLSQNLDGIDGGANYIFVGRTIYLDSAGMESLVGFVERGNTAFIAVRDVPQDLVYELYEVPCETYYDDEAGKEVDYNYWYDLNEVRSKEIRPQFVHDSLQNEQFIAEYKIKKKRDSYSFSFFDDYPFCEGSMDYDVIGQIGLDSVNFIRINKGEGNFFIHTNPILFTNILLKEEKGLNYSEKVFSHLPDGDVYWDDGSRYPKMNRRDVAADDIEIASPLSYVLSNRSLRWSWYTLLGMMLLYVLFGSKRRQRQIPVLEENSNTSLEFIQTVGRLYMQQDNHKKLAEHKMQLFLQHIREYYKIPTHSQDDSFMRRVSKKSGTAYPDLKNIFRMWGMIKNSTSISDSSLISFHHKLDEFYKNSK